MIFAISSLVVLLLARSALQIYGWPVIAANMPSVMAYQRAIEIAFTVAIGLVALWAISAVIRFVLDRVFHKVLRGNPLAQKLLPLLKHVSAFLVWGFGGVFLLSSIGVNVSALVTGAGIGGLVFAIASKELASNVFGSLSLVFGKFFRISDRIRIKGFEGTVQEISLSTTKLVDKAGHVVFMPNKFIMGDPIENLSEIESSSLSVSVAIPVAVDFDAVAEKLAKKAEKLGGHAMLTMTEYLVDKTTAKLVISASPDVFEAVRKGTLGELRKSLAS